MSRPAAVRVLQLPLVTRGGISSCISFAHMRGCTWGCVVCCCHVRGVCAGTHHALFAGHSSALVCMRCDLLCAVTCVACKLVRQEPCMHRQYWCDVYWLTLLLLQLAACCAAQKVHPTAGYDIGRVHEEQASCMLLPASSMRYISCCAQGLKATDSPGFALVFLLFQTAACIML